MKTACVHDEWKSRQIELIYKNAISLRSLIDRLMSFRKAESGHVKLRVAKGEIIEVLSRIYSSFYTMARGKDINYTFNTDVTIYFPMRSSLRLQAVIFLSM